MYTAEVFHIVLNARFRGNRLPVDLSEQVNTHIFSADAGCNRYDLSNNVNLLSWP